jgi:peptidoglycan/LPS O-acetylase OafA/YrhL
MPRQLLIPRLDSWPAWSLSGLQLVLALGLALLSWRYIETPFLRLKGSVPRLPHRRRDRAAPEAQGADTQTIPTSTADAPSTATTRI